MEDGKSPTGYGRVPEREMTSRRHYRSPSAESAAKASIQTQSSGSRCRVAPLALPEYPPSPPPLNLHTTQLKSSPEVSGSQFLACQKRRRQAEGEERSPEADRSPSPAHEVTADDKEAISDAGMVPQKVIISVGGQRFVTLASTLHRIPGTRLSLLTKSDPSYDPFCGEYFFDRNPKLFGYILDFYRMGELHFPHTQCGPILKLELEYWQIPEEYIAPCCWKTYTQYDEERKTLQILEETFNGPRKQLEEQHALHVLSGCKKWRQDLWVFLEDPTSSKAAQVI